MPTYASKWLHSFTDIDELQKQAAGLAGKGFRAMKMKMGGKTHKENLARFKAVREAVGEDVDIMVEGHWSWTVSEAIRMGRALEPYNIYWLEDPLGNILYTWFHDAEYESTERDAKMIGYEQTDWDEIGVWTKRERWDMTYYDAGDEAAEAKHVEDQMESYWPHYFKLPEDFFSSFSI